ncbi:hypothetical protein A3D72_01520 [Candidatus Uhrbacteria bacterium RIFCSPHIGHO2_02_FULL_57_19]|uniref:Phosphoribosyltransferase domain-containing protein n=1 Tax=Candidatus Uhrbacteria bacterium RIFCSPHIGHO2_02_FULL_57_19 TaxID=1802391 RepID=A0A1F7U264_9BACT|nr:MAG: hypothetical protein A3D72_01520 [Candidatus Uhrbacteria bacterium RIFCSPHIGHO2_02_FULL_57_19]
MVFRDRQDAGQKLAQALTKFKGDKTAVLLALPRGGVAVAAEIARQLKLPLDLVVPRKIGAPSNPEYAIGAITETGEGIMNETEVASVDRLWLKREMAKEKKEAGRRLAVYRGKRPPLDLAGKTVILVDDGVATGFTMRAAIASVRARKPKKIVVAVPHGAGDSIALLYKEADEVVVLETPVFYGAVGAFYESFPQVEDDEVTTIMKEFET